MSHEARGVVAKLHWNLKCTCSLKAKQKKNCMQTGSHGMLVMAGGAKCIAF